MKLIGEYGLKNKRQVWRVKYTLAKICKAASDLLALEDILGLKVEDFLEDVANPSLKSKLPNSRKLFRCSTRMEMAPSPRNWEPS